MTLPHHLVTVWNPSYASDAMDEHLAVLIDWAGRAQAGEAERDDVYVWWGKIRSPNRKGLLPHADAVAALEGLEIETAEVARREVDTEDGPRVALDTLVVASRPTIRA